MRVASVHINKGQVKVRKDKKIGEIIRNRRLVLDVKDSVKFEIAGKLL